MDLHRRLLDDLPSIGARPWRPGSCAAKHFRRYQGWGMTAKDDLLLPVALDGSPAQAFASHRVRASAIARWFALDRPLGGLSGQAGENEAVALLAHLQAVSDDPDFAADGQELSRTLVPKVLRRLNRGNGEVGTDGASTKRDYDMALKGLMTIAYRYHGPGLLSDD